MKPAPFHYHAPSSLDGALVLLAQYGSEGKLLAGGQSLVPTMNFRLARPSHLIDLNDVPGLGFIRDRDGDVEIGALVRHQDVAESPTLGRRNPLLVNAAGTIGYHAIRTRGTIGGSLAHADPAAQWPLMATLFDATIHAASRRGTRAIGAAEFFRAVFTTSLEPDEMITHIAFPALAADERWALRWFARRRGDFAIVAVAATMRVDDTGTLRDLRLAVGGAEPCPRSLTASLAGQIGQRVTQNEVNGIAAMAAVAVDPMADDRASVDFRRELVQHLTRRALYDCLKRVRA